MQLKKQFPLTNSSEGRTKHMSTGVPRLLLGTFLLLAMSSSAQPQTFSVTILGSLPGSSGSYAMKLNNRGQVVGGAYTATGPHAVLWDNRSIIDLHPGAAWMNSQANDVNNRGEIVGFAGAGVGAGFIYSRGAVSILPTLPGSVFNYPFSVNARGDIAGQANFNTSYVPFLYSQGSISRLPLLPGDTYGYATGINDSGQVVGLSHSGTGLLNSFFYSNDSIWKIDPLLVGRSIGVLGLNNAGEAVGNADFDRTGAIRHAFLYSNGATFDLGVPPGFNSSQAEAINSAGVIVGDGYFTHYGGTSHAFLYANGVWKDLNDLIPQTSGLVLKWASGINDRGEIVGTATSNGHDVAYLLRPPGGKINRRTESPKQLFNGNGSSLYFDPLANAQ